MAEADFFTKHPKLIPGQNQANPSKFHGHILYKVLTAVFFLVILPLVPSQAPEFINQTVLTRSWEFLHLLFVGIAVSYGLFSRRNEEKQNEITASKFDDAQSYVSGLLHVPSVFDDETEAESPNSASDETLVSSKKVQTWSNRYFRNEPVVVAEERPILNEQKVWKEKPLRLPVRSLKSRVADDNFADESETLSISKLRLGSKRLVSKSKRRINPELHGNLEELEDDLNENAVLRRRSRSSRMEMEEETDNPSLFAATASMEDSESNRISKPQISRAFSTAPKKSSSYSPVSPESQAKVAEDLLKKKNFYRSPPPPPPPPPPPGVRRISSMKPSSWLNDEAPLEKDFRRSLTSQPRISNRETRDSIAANSSFEDSSSLGKSVRKIRGGEAMAESPRTRREFAGNETKGKMDQNVEDFEENPMEFPDEDREELVGKLVMDDMESEEEDDLGGDFLGEENEGKFTVTEKESGSSSNNEEAAESSMASDGGPDVDKKADEFIAKFREQIRLQRIESIKRSSGQIGRNSSRQT